MRLFFQRLCCLFLVLGANTYGSTILVLGDSLSAGYGINPEKGWVNLLQKDLHPKHKIVNGSISGDTTGGGLERLPLLLEKFQPDFVVLELGGNDFWFEFDMIYFKHMRDKTMFLLVWK